MKRSTRSGNKHGVPSKSRGSSNKDPEYLEVESAEEQDPQDGYESDQVHEEDDSDGEQGSDEEPKSNGKQDSDEELDSEEEQHSDDEQNSDDNNQDSDDESQDSKNEGQRQGTNNRRTSDSQNDHDQSPKNKQGSGLVKDHGKTIYSKRGKTSGKESGHQSKNNESEPSNGSKIDVVVTSSSTYPKSSSTPTPTESPRKDKGEGLSTYEPKTRDGSRLDDIALKLSSTPAKGLPVSNTAESFSSPILTTNKPVLAQSTVSPMSPAVKGTPDATGQALPGLFSFSGLSTAHYPRLPKDFIEYFPMKSKGSTTTPPSKEPPKYPPIPSLLEPQISQPPQLFSVISQTSELNKSSSDLVHSKSPVPQKQQSPSSSSPSSQMSKVVLTPSILEPQAPLSKKSGLSMLPLSPLQGSASAQPVPKSRGSELFPNPPPFNGSFDGLMDKEPPLKGPSLSSVTSDKRKVPYHKGKRIIVNIPQSTSLNALNVISRASQETDLRRANLSGLAPTSTSHSRRHSETPRRGEIYPFTFGDSR
jgi:hypothetical protein